MMFMKPFISVVVPVKDYSEIPPGVIRSIARQDYHDFEVLFEHRGNQPQAMNLASSHAKGEYLLFWDDDVIAPPNAISAIMSDFKDDVAIVSFPYYSMNSNWIDRILIEEMPHVKCFVKSALLGFSMIRKSTFEKLGGLNEKLVGWNDLEFTERASKAGYKILFDPTVRLVHVKEPITMKGYTMNNFVRRAMFMKQLVKTKPSRLFRVMLYLSFPLIPLAWHMRRGIKFSLLHFIGGVSLAYGMFRG
jgi:GT2 family glycosyltransferase